jgi:hypothetical protein
MHTPFMILGLFDKRIDGDDCLLELARRRFQATGLGAEMHAGTPEQLEWMLKFRPFPDTPVVVHLARDLHLMVPDHRQRILRFAAQFAGRIHGMVMHDHPDMLRQGAEYLESVRELAVALQSIQQCPLLFIEYATGLSPHDYARCLATMRNLGAISACVDIGHVGGWCARQAYAQLHPGESVFALKQQNDRLPRVIADVEQAVQTALPAVVELIAALGKLGKPVHFHLHDGHPLSTINPLGISDHLSFLRELRLGFEYLGRRATPLLFGPSGLERITVQALRSLGPARVSFSLEIHPTTDQLDLGDSAPLFRHWHDKTNAERMNHWLAELGENQALLKTLLQKAAVVEAGNAICNIHFKNKVNT